MQSSICQTMKVLHICHAEEKTWPCVEKPLLLCPTSWRSQLQSWFNQVCMTLRASCLLRACAVCQSVLFSTGHPIDPRPLIVHLAGLRAIRTHAGTKFCILPALPFPIQSIRPICPLPCFLSCGKWAPTVAGSHYAMRRDDVWSLWHFCFKFNMHPMFCLCPRNNTVIQKGGKLLLVFKLGTCILMGATAVQLYTKDWRTVELSVLWNNSGLTL